MFGNEWICTNCNWHNFFIRMKCRNCGKEKGVEEKVESWREVMERQHNISKTIDQEKKIT
jgi:hypothetical protein